jgi:glycosyltransferase involved in cell wall biosynthesis
VSPRRSPTVSIIINNANNVEFIGTAIESAIDQEVAPCEVIVVDDGSSDGSGDVISAFADQVTAIFQPNRGQTSAVNVGYEASSGDVVCFLDGDDLLFPTAVETAGALLSHGLARACWPLRVVDRAGRSMGRVVPEGLPATNPLAAVLDDPTAVATPMSSNAWTREFLQSIFPLPEIEAEVGSGQAMADALLSMTASLWSDIATTPIPQGGYRMHGANISARGLQERARRHVAIFRHHCTYFAAYAGRRGVEVDAEQLRQRSFWYRLDQSYQEIADVTAGAKVAIVDDGWGGHNGPLFQGVPFPQVNGSWLGPPNDDDMAIDELTRERKAGLAFLVLFWPAFWWLEHYERFAAHLEGSARVVVSNDRYVAFDLR